jgi:hypothetical protein
MEFKEILKYNKKKLKRWSRILELYNDIFKVKKI